MCASFNTALNAIIIRNVHRSLARVYLVLWKETHDNRQMHEAVAHCVRFVSFRR